MVQFFLLKNRYNRLFWSKIIYFNQTLHQENCLAIVQYFLEKLAQLFILIIVYRKVQLRVSREQNFIPIQKKNRTFVIKCVLKETNSTKLLQHDNIITIRSEKFIFWQIVGLLVTFKFQLRLSCFYIYIFGGFTFFCIINFEPASFAMQLFGIVGTQM